ncbi:MAG: L-alanine-DL-glutamate epimerase-like enolase superfamily enzyme [Alteromonadaceae bacterium]|jgi:L-alanine-DL-glutamate epimerase-like enolase superfamily enzyme
MNSTAKKIAKKTTATTANYQIKVEHQQLPLTSIFRIARGAKTQADVVVVILTDGQYSGWAEAVPYARYDESVDSVIAQIKQLAAYTMNKQNITSVISMMPAGAARNALDCALWDLKAKQQNTSVVKLLSLPSPKPCITAQTLSIDTPQAMAKAVNELNNPPLVKVKLDRNHIIEKMTAIQAAAPHSQFIIDANEGWSMNDLLAYTLDLKKLNVVLIEQPLPAGKDQALLDFNSPIPLCADESCHTRAELDYLKGRYEVINIKLDKTGGLTEAYKLAQEAQEQGFDIMLGCMVASSLAMAPASLLTHYAKFVDLDGPLLISKDRPLGFEFVHGEMQVLNPALWGSKNE